MGTVRVEVPTTTQKKSPKCGRGTVEVVPRWVVVGVRYVW